MVADLTDQDDRSLRTMPATILFLPHIRYIPILCYRAAAVQRHGRGPHILLSRFPHAELWKATHQTLQTAVDKTAIAGIRVVAALDGARRYSVGTAGCRVTCEEEMMVAVAAIVFDTEVVEAGECVKHPE
jgi:hypothetical protein